MTDYRFVASAKMGALLALLIATGASAANPPATATPEPGALSLELALKAARAALQSCTANGYPNAAVAVTDVTGLVVVVLRAPAAPEPTIESARRKAYTSAKKGMSTAQFAQSKGWVDPNPPPRPGSAPPTAAAVGGNSAAAGAANPFFGLPVFENDPSLVPWGGGLPLKSGTKLIGGIGLSGAAGGQKDEDCSKAGADALSSELPGG